MNDGRNTNKKPYGNTRNAPTHDAPTKLGVQNLGAQSSGGTKTGGIIELCRKLISEGWSLRIKRRGSSQYLYARKVIEGKRKETYIARVDEDVIVELKKQGLLATKRKREFQKVHSQKASEITQKDNHTTTRSSPSQGHGGNGSNNGDGKVTPHVGGFGVGFHGLVFVLRFRVGVGGLGGRGFVFRGSDGVWVRDFVVLGRRVRVVVSRRGVVSVFVGCSGNPVSFGEFPRFVEGLLGALSGVFGRNVGVDDVVVKNFECNVDLPEELPSDVSRVELSIHRVGDRVRREVRFSGELPLRLLIEDGFIRDLFSLRGVNAIKNGLALLKDIAVYISGSSFIDRMHKALRDIAEALDKGGVHNLMLHIDIPPKTIPKDYVRKGNVYVKKLTTPWSKPLLPQAIELWVSRRSTTIYVKASSSPMGYEELVKVLALIQNELRRIYGRPIDEDEMRVVRVEYNIDRPVSITLQDMVITVRDVDSEYRSYVKTLPTGDAVRREELVMRNGGTMASLIEEFRAKVSIGKTLNEIKGRLDRLSNSVSMLEELRMLVEDLKSLKDELSQISQLISSLTTLFNNLSDLISKVTDVVGAGVAGATARAEREPAIAFHELPVKLRDFLLRLEEDGYVRVMEDRVAYGDRVWAAIRRLKSNIDGWIEWESINYGSKAWLFKGVLKAIRYYDNRYNGKPGVPYRKFLEALRYYIPREKFEELMRE